MAIEKTQPTLRPQLSKILHAALGMVYLYVGPEHASDKINKSLQYIGGILTLFRRQKREIA